MPNAMKIETYTDKRGKIRWRFIAGNGEQIARSSKGYADDCSLVEDLAHIVDKNHDAQLYKDKKGEWRWRFRHHDGHIIAVASESYHNKSDCKSGSDLLLDANISTQGAN